MNEEKMRTEMAALRKERDAYRKALERIYVIAPCVSDGLEVLENFCVDAVDIAEDALGGDEE